MEYERKSTVNHLKLQRDPMSRDTAPIETLATNEQTGRRYIQLSVDPSQPRWIEIGEFLTMACRELMSNEVMIYKFRVAYERNKTKTDFSDDIGKSLEPVLIESYNSQ